jgi:Flp pilus assembly protein TadB
VKAGAIGLLAQLLFIPMLVITIVVLVATLIGIPLLVLVPFAIIGLGAVGLVGFTGVAYARRRTRGGTAGLHAVV